MPEQAEDVVLRYSVPLCGKVVVCGNAGIFLGAMVFVGSLCAGVSPAIPLLAFVAVMGIAYRVFPWTLTVTIRQGSIRLGRRELSFDDVERLGRLPWWVPRQVGFWLRGARGASLIRRLFLSHIPLPGHKRFQARLVEAIRARRPEMIVGEDVDDLLALPTGPRWKARAPSVLGFCIAVTGWSYILVKSATELAAAGTLHWIPAGAFVVVCWSLSPDMDGLHEEPPWRAALAVLAAQAIVLALGLWVVLLCYGGLQFAPLLYAGAIAASLAGLVARLPIRLRSWQIGLGAAAATVLLAMTWAATLHGTLPAEKLTIWPPAGSVTFAEDGETLLLVGNGFHVLDLRDGRRTTVVGRPDEFFPTTPTAGGMGVCHARRGDECVLFAVTP
ncbi:MAG: hypothetical protein ACYTFI_25025, partial [Planctomycetota bacterium]